MIDFIRGSLAFVPKAPHVLELGGRDVNGSIKPLFEDARSYTSLDIRPGPGVDIVADASTYESVILYDVVVCTEVLEHAPCAEAICRNAYRLLRKDGVFLVTTAFTGRFAHSDVDGRPLGDGEWTDDPAVYARGERGYWYRNITREDMEHYLRDFGRQHVIDVLGHDIRAMAWK